MFTVFLTLRPSLYSREQFIQINECYLQSLIELDVIALCSQTNRPVRNRQRYFSPYRATKAFSFQACAHVAWISSAEKAEERNKNSLPPPSYVRKPRVPSDGAAIVDRVGLSMNYFDSARSFERSRYLPRVALVTMQEVLRQVQAGLRLTARSNETRNVDVESEKWVECESRYARPALVYLCIFH